MQVLFEIMGQNKQKRALGVENPSPTSFSGGPKSAIWSKETPPPGRFPIHYVPWWRAKKNEAWEKLHGNPDIADIWCHMYCTQLGPLWTTIVGASRSDSNRESWYPPPRGGGFFRSNWRIGVNLDHQLVVTCLHWKVGVFSIKSSSSPYILYWCWKWGSESTLNSWKWLRESSLNSWKWMIELNLNSWEWMSESNLTSWKWMSESSLNSWSGWVGRPWTLQSE